MLEARAKDTAASVLQKKKQKKDFKQIFQAISREGKKKGIRKFFARFLAFPNKVLPVQKIVLSSSRRQGNFRGLEAWRPRPRA